MAPLVPGWPLPGRWSGALGAGRGWGSGTHESGRDGTRDPGCRWWGQEARGQWGWGSRAVDSSKGEGVSTYGDWPVSWVKSRRFIVVKEIKTAKSRLPHCAAEASQAPGCGPSSPGAAPPIQRSPCTFLQRRESLSREAGWARGLGLGLCGSLVSPLTPALGAGRAPGGVSGCWPPDGLAALPSCVLGAPAALSTGNRSPGPSPGGPLAGRHPFPTGAPAASVGPGPAPSSVLGGGDLSDR